MTLRTDRALLDLAATFLPRDSADLAYVTDLDELSRALNERLNRVGANQG